MSKFPGLEAALKSIGKLDGVEITLGVQGTAAATAPGPSAPGELVEIATRLHYGDGGIPPRPWLSKAFRDNRVTWRRAAEKIVRQASAEDFPGAVLTIRRLGVVMVGHAQTAIRNGGWAPNSPATIARKGSDKPLIDTGQLIQSQRSQIKIPGVGTEVIG
jgi:hypothetical protein